MDSLKISMKILYWKNQISINMDINSENHWIFMKMELWKKKLSINRIPPEGGSVSITPAIGDALITKFEITVADF